MARRKGNGRRRSKKREGSHDTTRDADLSRREFLSGLAVAAGALAVSGCGGGDDGGSSSGTTDVSPTATTGATSTPTTQPSATQSSTPNNTRTSTPTATATTAPSETPTSTPTVTEAPTSSPTPTPSPTSTPSDPEMAPLPDPASSGIQHIIVVMMENRSFDHFLGWLPGADGMQAGLTFTDKQGKPQPTFPLAPDFQNCHLDDPDHSYGGGRVQFNGGASDGWLRARTNDLFPIGYYTQEDLALYGTVVPAFTAFDRYFCGFLGPTFPNRLYLHAAQTDRLSNALVVSTIPTIWDRILAAGLTATYYFSDLPVLALWGNRYSSISKPIDQFFADASAGNLSNVSYIDPRFLGEGQGISNDDHPLADIRNGQAFLSSIYDAVTSSPNWPDTVLVINYDEWGGFFDHVPPPLAPQTELDPTIGNDGRLGFRVPCIMISPLARRGFVGHLQYDHTSILNMIEWRWGLEPLTVRDMTANNLARALDFTKPKDLTAPVIPVGQGPFGVNCDEQVVSRRAEFYALRVMAERFRFRRPH